jgi:D-glycero-alpha-D-manno-heptose-7-phosphate kinase
MIITQTPLRISFLGGGTDFREYFLYEDGWVVSCAIDKYIFVTIKERYDDRIRVGYTKTELVDDIDELEHELVRECLRKTGITKRVEISTMGDIPSEGSGLGSSSTVTVGLLNAMYTYLGKSKEAETLAREACEIEIDILHKPIGMQDQYIAAYGGQRFIRFCRSGAIQVDPLCLERDQVRRLNRNLMLFFTGVTRKSATILTEQVQNMANRLPVLRKMKRLALECKSCVEAGEFDALGCLLDEGWQLKRQMATSISNGNLDELYGRARCAGALGGKITGAGGGGYLLLYVPQQKQDDVRHALKEFDELPFNLESDGSKVIFNYRHM